MSDWDDVYNGCCDFGFVKVRAFGDDEWFVAGAKAGEASFYLLKQSNGFESLADQRGKGSVVLCDGEDNFYSIKESSHEPAAGFPRFERYGPDHALDWGYDDAEISIRSPGAFEDPTLGVIAYHFDVDADLNLYYCGFNANAIVLHEIEANYEARLRKLDSSGASLWMAEAFTAFPSNQTAYRFLSCASDPNGNVCAVGFRRNASGTFAGGITIDKSDYIVYYYDADGNEVWNDEVPDDPTENTDNLNLWATQVCFDDSGNVYVGFSHNFGSSTDRPFVRKYDSAGNVLWTKTITASDVCLFALLLTPDEKLVVQWLEDLDASLNTGSTVRQYSGANHSTTDWTVPFSSPSIGSDMTCDATGNIYATQVNNGAGSGHFLKIEGSTGDTLYTGVEDLLILRASAKPGNHPHFI